MFLPYVTYLLLKLVIGAIEMKGILRCKITIISESAVCKKFLGQIVSYPASLLIFNSHSLECYFVLLMFLFILMYA